MMKSIRYIIMALCSLLWLSSCQQEEMQNSVVQTSDDVITFSISVPHIISTREGKESGSTNLPDYLLTFDKFNEFYVTSFKGNNSGKELYFEDTFKSTTNMVDKKKLYTSDTEYHWPKTPIEFPVDFYAYYPSVDALHTYADNDENVDNADNSHFQFSNDPDGYKLKDFRISHDMRKKVDFVAAFAQKKYEDVAPNMNKRDSIVNLEFDHKLCKVEFQAFSDNNDYDYEIMGIRLGNQAMEADYNFNGSDELIQGENKPYSVKNKQWENIKVRNFEYIFKPGEKVARLPKKEASQLHADSVSIMGDAKAALVIPIRNESWTKIYGNGSTSIEPCPTEQMYISVLIRVSRNGGKNIAFPYDHASEYPYPDAQGTEKSEKQVHYNKFFEHIVYYAVDIRPESKGTILYPVYFREDLPNWCYLDPDGEIPFDWTDYEKCDFEGFGWAAIDMPVDWEAGKQYTYTLDFSKGLGLHDPDQPDAGKPIYNVTHPTVTWGKRVNWGVKVNPWAPPKDFDPDVEIDFE